MAITKNRQSEETIFGMARRAFPDKQIAVIKELTEGMCNYPCHHLKGDTVLNRHRLRMLFCSC